MDKNIAALGDGVASSVALVVSLTDVVDSGAQSGAVTTSVVYTFTLTNTGNSEDTFTITKSGDIWTTVISDTSHTLAALDSAVFTVTVTVPLAADTNDTDIVTIVATSDADPGVSDSDILTTTATGGYLVYDTFSDTDTTALAAHTPEKGGPWTENSGTWLIDTNKLKETVGDVKVCSIDAGQANIVMSASLDRQGGSDPGMIFRMTDISNYYALIANFLGVLAIYKIVSGAWTLLGTTAYVHVANDTLKVDASGTSLIAYVNDVEFINITDSTFPTQTRVGLFNHVGNWSSTRWDNFVVQAL